MLLHHRLSRVPSLSPAAGPSFQKTEVDFRASGNRYRRQLKGDPGQIQSPLNAGNSSLRMRAHHRIFFQSLTARAVHSTQVEVPAMSAGVFASIEAQPTRLTPPPLPCVTTSVSVPADRQRLFQVLTVGEYMEAWLSLPEVSPESHLEVTSTPDRFRINHIRSRQVVLSITGAYHTCRRGKLQFSWHKETRHGAWTSLVQIRLHGDFGRTNVALTHTRLSSRSDYAWHQDLWEKSLRRLCSLFRTSLRDSGTSGLSVIG